MAYDPEQLQIDPELANAVQAAHQAATAPQPDPNAPPKIKIPIGNQTVELDPDQVPAFMNNYIAQTQQMLAEQQARSAEALRAPQAVQAGAPQVDPEFDEKEFADIIKNKPKEMGNYLMERSQVGRNLMKQVQQQSQIATSAAIQLEEYKFLDTNKDFPANDDRAKQLLAQTLKMANLPPNAMGLTMAWDFINRRGLYQAPQAPPQAQPQYAAPQAEPVTQPQYAAPQYQMQPQPNLGFAGQLQQPAGQQGPYVPPTVRRGGSGDPMSSIIQAAEDMSTAQLTKVLLDFDKRRQAQ